MSNQPETSSQPMPAKRYTVRSMVILAVLVIVGIILIWVGQLVLVASIPEGSAAARSAYRNSLILTGVGAMISSATLIGGALTMDSLDKFVRLGMILAAAFIIVRVLALGVVYPYGFL